MWTLVDSQTPPLWRRVPEDGAWTLGFSTRLGGVSAPPYESLNLGRSTPDPPEAVEENRRRLLGALGLKSTRLATAGQVHGREVARVSGPGHVAGCDALLTCTPDLALAVTTADCMSLILTARGAVAVAHAGWRGTADGMPAAVLQALLEASGVGPESVSVHFGPCIRSCCYEVGADVASRFPGDALITAGARWRLDLPLAARGQLVAAGVPAAAIADVGECTACNPLRYFSHRRDRGVAGRHWAVAALRP